MKRIILSAATAALFMASCTAQDNTRMISQDDFVRTAEQTVNGVVSVKSYATPQVRQQGYDNYSNDPLLEFFFGQPRQRQSPRRQQEQPRQQQLGLGSGVIISDDGYIVTNNHVIADAERLEVTLNDNRNFPATVVGTDPTTDLALIKIDAPQLHVIPMGNSEDLRVGEWVLAVGNPFGFTSTVTSGIVSAKARNISTTTGMPSSGGIESYIQTDAAVNQGNSGGALVNLKGELVGINTAIYSSTGTYAGCSFAIPTSIVQKVIGDIKSYGTVQRAYLGIRFIELSPELINEKKLNGPTSGIYVAEIEERSAAMAAGLAEGDIITAINGKPTRTTAEMQEVITHFSPGDEVNIEYYRDGKAYSVETTLRNNRGGVALTKTNDSGNLGAKMASIDEETARRLQIRGGVALSDLDSDGLLASAGIREGFIILGVNGQRVSKPDQINSMARTIAQSQGGDKVLFISGIYPTGKAAYYAVALEE
ncbi:MAG: Do family serine endopeptidase [Muribaculaceae bacterium]